MYIGTLKGVISEAIVDYMSKFAQSVPDIPFMYYHFPGVTQAPGNNNINIILAGFFCTVLCRRYNPMHPM